MEKLYRSRRDKLIGGVCSGLGKNLGFDPTLVRLFFVLLALASGIGLLVYLALWFIVPPEEVEAAGGKETLRTGADEIGERARAMGDDLREAIRSPHPQAGLIAGTTLILLGVVFLLQSLNLPWLGWLRFRVLWPILLVLGGLALLWRYYKEGGRR